MRTAQCFVECNKEELYLPDTVNPSEEHRRSQMQSLTEGFWNMATVIFRSDILKHPKIADEIYESFLATVEMMLKVDIWARDGNTDIWPWDRCFIVPYVLRHRSQLPIGFVRTLRKADEERIIDVACIFSWSGSASLEELHGIDGPSKFWSALESVQTNINPRLRSNSNSS
jgi:hypothetical protein